MSSNRPKILDLFCGAGGAAMGYYRAGFEVMGIDHQHQPNYPFTFWLSDALSWMKQRLGTFDAIHASPPCQAFTAYRRSGVVGDGHQDHWIAVTRWYLEMTGLPYVIENVERARPEMINPLMICATMFDPVPAIQRHRLFETNWPLEAPPWPCRHMLNGRDNYPGGRSVARTGHSRGLVRATIEIGTWDIPMAEQEAAMGIDWMTREELSQAIPPSYTEFIGRKLRLHLEPEGVVESPADMEDK